jgi:hypothetical protein
MKTAFNFKKTLIIIFLMVAGTTTGFAQCDQTVTLTSSKTSQLDDQGNIDSRDEHTVITISKTEITITPGSDHKMSGPISSKTCDWKTPFKEGKTVIKAKLSDENGDHEKNATITITGAAGKVTLTFEAEEKPGKKIQVIADKFE